MKIKELKSKYKKINNELKRLNERNYEEIAQNFIAVNTMNKHLLEQNEKLAEIIPLLTADLEKTVNYMTEIKENNEKITIYSIIIFFMTSINLLFLILGKFTLC